MADNYPIINGVMYDFSCVEINIDGKSYTGVKEISYNDSLEPGDVYGARANKIGRTRGQAKPGGSMTMYKESWLELLEGLGDGFGEEVFEIVINYRKPGTSLVTDVLEGVRITKVDQSASGTDALETKLELSVMDISHDGFYMTK